MSIIVVGGAGQLGSALINKLACLQIKNIISIDVKNNSQAHENISASLSISDIFSKLEKCNFSKSNILEAVYCMAGGWCMDNAIDTNPESLSINLDKMYEGNMKSSILALSIASKYFSPIMENQDNDNKINNDINQEKKRGLLVLTGAKAALKSTPSMLTYGMTKAAVIHLIRSQSDSSPSTKNSKFKTIGILPEVLDTDSNRHSMPTADKGTWTPLDRVVDLLVGWRDDCNLPSGTLVQIVTRKGDTVCTPLLS